MHYVPKMTQIGAIKDPFTAGLLVAVLVSTGCESASVADEERSLENLPIWTLEEELRLGDPDLPEGFSRVTDVAVGPDQRIYVLDGREHEVRVFDRQGQSIGRFGGQGEGPGELMFPSALGLVADTLWVRNGSALRLTLYSIDGSVIRTVSVGDEAPQVLGPGGVPIRVAMASLRPDGFIDPRYVFSPRPEAMGPWGDSVKVPQILFDADGRWVERDDSTTVFPESQTAQIEVSGFQFPVQRSLFQDHPLLIEEAGSRVVVYRWAPTSETDARVVVSGTSLAEDPAGWEREYSFDPVRLQPAQGDSIIRALAERHQENLGQVVGRAPPLAQLEEELSDLIDVPNFLPPVTGVHRADNGSVWLRREMFNRDPVRWAVLSAQGRPLAEVHLPNAAVVQAITDQHVWAVVPDHLGVPYVVGYRINSDG